MIRISTRISAPIAIAMACCAGHAMAQSCAVWDVPFGDPGVTGQPTHNQSQEWEPWVRAFTQHDLGTGPILFATGAFTHIGGVPARHVGMSTDGGYTWQAMGDGLYHDGTILNWSRVWTSAGFGNSVYFGGMFTTAGGNFASRIARWDGELWHEVGGGLGGTISPTLIEARSMAVYDDGRGDALYVGGRFPTAGGITVNNIARWNGTAWEALGSGITPVSGSGQSVYALAAFQGKLYAGGNFRRAGGINAERIASWDGTSWAALPGAQLSNDVYDLIVHDDGSGEALFAAGGFMTGGGVALRGVGKFDGAAWHAIGDGVVIDDFIEAAFSIAVIDDGTGAKLYAGGYLPHLNHLARFNGATWEVLDGGVALGDPPVVSELKAFDNRLHIGGQFQVAGMAMVGSMARWGCPIEPDPCYADCDGNEALNVDDFLCFINEFAAAQGLPTSQQIVHYANCDGSTAEPVLTVDDFLCFINEFAQGCP
jgi:trimeric autotransporter adhesin